MEYFYVPSRQKLENTNLFKFIKKYDIDSIEDLYNKADRNQDWFWNAVIEDCNIEFFKKFTKIADYSKGVEWVRWFVDGKINITYNAVERFKNLNSPAIKYERENAEYGEISFKDLDSFTAKLSGSLIKLGINKGDRVGIYMPMSPEAVIAFYSVLRIGAVAVPIFSGYGKEALQSRLEDAEIEVLFVTYSYRRKGKEMMMIDIARSIPNLTRIVYGAKDLEENEYDFNELIENGEYLKSTMTESEDPAIMLYTSGTTGRPKGTIHSHAGTVVNTAKEVKYYLDFNENDTLYWVTDLGWMMGPWAIIGANSLKGSVFVYDGAVDYPDSFRLWDIIERNKITHLGISPTLIRTLKAKNMDRRMIGVKVFGSTGEPWDEEGWLWLFEKFGGGEVPIANISGGTDIIGCFLASTPAMPLSPRCLYRGLGMNVSVFDDQGTEIFDNVGYLVAKKPAPSMTRGLWKQENKYLETYWTRFPHTWFHGDWALMNKDGYFFLYGRTDDVIKVAGKRVGPNELENLAMRVKGVKECAAIGIPDKIKGEAIVILYVGAENVGTDIKEIIETDLGKSFSPKHIIPVPDLPKTRNGKIMRRIAKTAFLNQDVGDLSNIEKKEIITIIRELGRKYLSF